MVGGNRTCLYPWIGTLFPEKFFTHEGRISGTVQQLPDSMECLLQKQYTGIRCRYDLSATCVRFYPVSSSDVWCDAALYDKAEAVSVVTGDHDPECRTACECSTVLERVCILFCGTAPSVLRSICKGACCIPGKKGRTQKAGTRIFPADDFIGLYCSGCSRDCFAWRNSVRSSGRSNCEKWKAVLYFSNTAGR